LQQRLDELSRQFDSLLDLCKERKAVLHRAKEYFVFVQNFEEEMGWLGEKEDFCRHALKKRDVTNVPHATRQYKVGSCLIACNYGFPHSFLLQTLELEMQAHWQRSKAIINSGERLQPTSAHTKEDVQTRVHALQSKWEALRRAVAALAKWLGEAEKASQYFQDANDAESWIK